MTNIISRSLIQKSLLLFSLLFLAPYSVSVAQAADLPTVSPQDAARLVSEGVALLVDVREKNETISGSAEPALLMPLSEMEKNTVTWNSFVADLPKDKMIIVYCRSGRRSEIVGQKLATLGFHVQNMGAFQGWVDAGLPVKK